MAQTTIDDDWARILFAYPAAIVVRRVYISKRISNKSHNRKGQCNINLKKRSVPLKCVRFSSSLSELSQAPVVVQFSLTKK